MSSKILRIQFPSGKIPVRAQPDMKSDTLKLLCTGTEIEVLADLNSGYYVLANNQVRDYKKFEKSSTSVSSSFVRVT